MKSPWQTLDSELVYENPWIKVTHRKVINPSGSSGIYGVVHFKNVALAVVPLDEEGNTWLVGQYRYTLDQYSWEVPEGGGKPNVPPEETAKRELEEETGITALEWFPVGEIHTSNSVTDELGLIFVAKDLYFGEPSPEETEELEVRKLPFEEAVEMVMRGDITDGLSVAAILKVKLMRDRNLL